MEHPLKKIWLPVTLVALVITVVTSLLLYYRAFQLAESGLADWVEQIEFSWKRNPSPDSEEMDFIRSRGGNFLVISREADGKENNPSLHPVYVRQQEINAARKGQQGKANYSINGEHYIAAYQPLNDESALIITSSLAAMDRYYLTLFATMLGINFVLVLSVLLIYHFFSGYRLRYSGNTRLSSSLNSEHISGVALLLGKGQKIIECSPGTAERFGLANGQRLQSLLPEKDRNRITAVLQQAFDQHATADFECSLTENNDEQSRWLIHIRPWQHSNQQYLVLTGEDITRRMYIEKELNAERQRVNAYFNAMQTLLITCDEQGRIVRMNQPAQSLLETTTEQISGQPFEHILPRPGADIFRDGWQKVMNGNNEHLSVIFPVLATSGRESVLRWQLTPLSGSAASEREEKVLLAGLDISEEVANREALEKANARIRDALEEAERANRSKSVFLASMSHEIRTPMNGILGAAELLMDSALNEDQQQYLQIIHSSSHVLLDIINDILDLSKIESGKLEIESISFDLNELLTSLYQLFKEPARKKGLSLVYLYDGDMPRLWLGDPKRVRQIITNLLSNSLKFTDNGCIELRATGEAINERQYNVRIAVKDQGIGIAEDKQQQVFEAFRQADSSTSRQYGGTGLGLTISQHLARAMGGDLKLQSESGYGSTFTLELPLYQAQSVQEEVRRSPDKPLPGLSGHVLLAEDNAVNQKIAEKMLDRLGVQVTTVENGEEAIGRIMEQDFDLVLMDVNMPVMDGIEATERIRDLSSNKSSIPIIALTANAMLQDKKRCLEAGMNGFISKPIRMDELATALREVLAGQDQETSTSP